MFVHLAIHHPKPEYTDEVLASMQRVDAAAHGRPGLVQMGAWRDGRSDRLVGLAIWTDRASFEAAHDEIFAVVADDPFDKWVTQPPDVFHLSPAG
jgi:heme-degrading monooxygenase HmoA